MPLWITSEKPNMKKILSTIAAICFLTTAAADSVPFGNGQLSFTPIARNAVRIQYQEGEVKQELPEWISRLRNISSATEKPP